MEKNLEQSSENNSIIGKLTSMIDSGNFYPKNEWIILGEKFCKNNDYKHASIAFSKTGKDPLNQLRGKVCCLMSGNFDNLFGDLVEVNSIPSQGEEFNLLSKYIETLSLVIKGEFDNAWYESISMWEDWEASSMMPYLTLPSLIWNRVLFLRISLLEWAGDVFSCYSTLQTINKSSNIDLTLAPFVSVYSHLMGMHPEDIDLEDDIYELLKRVTGKDRKLVNYLGIPSASEDPFPALKAVIDTQKASENENLAERNCLLLELIQNRKTNLLARQLYLDGLVESQNSDVIQYMHAEGLPLLLTKNGQRAYMKNIGGNTSDLPIPISFISLGGGDSIGASAYFLLVGNTKILLDAGLRPPEDPNKTYHDLEKRLRDSGLCNDGISGIDVIFLSHAHLDHSGLIPALVKALPKVGQDVPRARLYCSEATKELARIILKDASHRFLDVPNVPPLYRPEDVDNALKHFIEPPSDGTNIFPFPKRGWIKLLNSGHILGGKMAWIELDGVKILFTGDIGGNSQLSTKPIISPLEIQTPDILIIESTNGYGRDELLYCRDIQERILFETLDNVLMKGDSLLLPSYTLGRAQEMLAIVARHSSLNPGLVYDIVIDGLAALATRVWEGLRFQHETPKIFLDLIKKIQTKLIRGDESNGDREEFIQEQIQNPPKVIIASSGALKQGSTSYEYARKMDKKNIIRTGYFESEWDSEDITPPSRENETQLTSDNKKLRFSAHATLEELFRFVINLRPKYTLLIHGEPNKNANKPITIMNLLQAIERPGFEVRISHDEEVIKILRKN